MSRLSRSEIRKRREVARTKGYQFKLPDFTNLQDGKPFYVYLRKLSLQEKAAVNGISESTQKYVREKTIGLAKFQEENRGESMENIAQAIQDNPALTDAVNSVVWAAMIDPPVTLNEEESTDDLWFIEDFTYEDRWSIFLAASERSSKEAKSLRLFREESDSDVADLATDSASEASE